MIHYLINLAYPTVTELVYLGENLPEISPPAQPHESTSIGAELAAMRLIHYFMKCSLILFMPVSELVCILELLILLKNCRIFCLQKLVSIGKNVIIRARDECLHLSSGGGGTHP